MKHRLSRARLHLAPLYRARYGTFDARDLCDELASRLRSDFEILMVHCSLNDLVPLYTDGPRELLDCLLALCGADRTLAMPAFFFGGADADPVKHYRRHPIFDARRQPSEMGLLSELFRRRPGVLRSLHPTASICAFGPLAEELVQGHHLADTSFGEGTPFGIMATRATAVVGIGTEYFRSLSQVHAAEDLLGSRYPLDLRPNALPVTLRTVDGEIHEYNLAFGDDAIERRMDLLSYLLRPEALKTWRFHGVPMFAASAGEVTSALVAAALRRETIYAELPIRRGHAVGPDAEADE